MTPIKKNVEQKNPDPKDTWNVVSFLSASIYAVQNRQDNSPAKGIYIGNKSIKGTCAALQADSLLPEPPAKPGHQLWPQMVENINFSG